MSGAQLQFSPLGLAGHLDEAALPSGELRPQWETLMEGLERLGAAELERRWHQGQRLLEENGVTYNVYGDPRGIDRPWPLDAIPMLVSPEEWRAVETAVTQRARLLSAVLSDVYGPQRLLKDGSLPAELVYAHPGFLRPCHGVEVPQGNPLIFYSADLGRSPDGRWWVISDRTQAPSGSGYALENRVVLSRILPELFQTFHVQRLANYFQAVQESVAALAPKRRDNPRVVLLTPGPYNETYFEHAYLSRYLGFTLVEGADLTVRDEHLYLKTLSGLWPVDVVLRRQDDQYCDPLELHGESTLGVAGLLQAIRAGNVAVCNALGTGVLETAAIMAFLPGLCRSLLGEELLMPSVATWWCGQERELAFVKDHLPELVIKPAFPGAQREVVFGGELDSAGIERVRAELTRRPLQYVAQERVALSTAPTGFGLAPEPRHLVLRVFAAAANGTYVVMPGGLTRFSTAQDNLVVSIQAGGGSKDTWVLANEPTPYVSLLERVSRPIDVSRDTYALTSRVADDLFWLGRMSERLESGVRLFRTALWTLSENLQEGPDVPVSEVIDLIGQMGRLPATDGGGEGEGLPRPEDLVLRGLFDHDLRNSLRNDAIQLHRLAWRLRDRISADAWRILSQLDQRFDEPEHTPALRASQALHLLDQMLITLSAFSGLVMESTTRGLGWRFLVVGRRLERGLQVVELLRFGLGDELPPDSRRLQKVLEIADCSMTYRSRYLTSPQLPLVVDLLLLDEANPRSLSFQVARIHEDLRPLERASSERLLALLDRLRGAKVEELVALQPNGEGEGRRVPLDQLLAQSVEVLLELSDSLNHAYLSHAVPKRQPATFGGAGP